MNARPLRAAELREALRLVAAELDALGTHPSDPYRWGKLQAHLASLQDPGMAPFALSALRRTATVGQAGKEVPSP